MGEEGGGISEKEGSQSRAFVGLVHAVRDNKKHTSAVLEIRRVAAHDSRLFTEQREEREKTHLEPG